MWQGGLLLDYPRQAAPTLTESRYLSTHHQVVTEAEAEEETKGFGPEGLRPSLKLSPVTLKWREGELRAAGWWGRRDSFALGLGQAPLAAEPVGAEPMATAGFHAAALTPAGQLHLALGSSAEILVQERWPLTQVIRQVVLDREVSDAAPLQVLFGVERWAPARDSHEPLFCLQP